MGDIYLEVGRNVNQAWPKLTTSMVKSYHEHGRNIPRTQSKHATSTVKTYHEHHHNPIHNGQSIRIVTTYLENCQVMPRERLKYTASIVKTYHENCRFKHITSTVKTKNSSGVEIFSKTFKTSEL